MTSQNAKEFFDIIVEADGESFCKHISTVSTDDIRDYLTLYEDDKLNKFWQHLYERCENIRDKLKKVSGVESEDEVPVAEERIPGDVELSIVKCIIKMCHVMLTAFYKTTLTSSTLSPPIMEKFRDTLLTLHAMLPLLSEVSAAASDGDDDDANMKNKQQVTTQICHLMCCCWVKAQPEGEGSRVIDKEFAGKLLYHTLPLYLSWCSVASATPAARFKELLQMKNFLHMLSWAHLSDASTGKIFKLLVKCAHSPTFLHKDRGKQFLSYALSINVRLTSALHNGIKDGLHIHPEKAVYRAYGEINYRAWKTCCQPEVHSVLEETCLVDYIHLAINSRDDEYANKLQHFLIYIIEHRKEAGVDELLFRCVWAKVKVAIQYDNPVLLCRSLQILAAGYPLWSVKNTPRRSQVEHATQQLDRVIELCKCKYLSVRVQAIKALALILTTHWQIVGECDDMDRQAIIMQHMLSMTRDAGSVDVRYVTVTSVKSMIENIDIHPYISKFIRKTNFLLYDDSAKVCVAYIQLVHKLCQCSSSQHLSSYTSLVDVGSVMSVLSRGEPTVCDAIINLLLRHECFPARDVRTQLLQCARMIRDHPKAVTTFYSTLVDTLTAKQIARFMTAAWDEIVSCISLETSKLSILQESMRAPASAAATAQLSALLSHTHITDSVKLPSSSDKRKSNDEHETGTTTLTSPTQPPVFTLHDKDIVNGLLKVTVILWRAAIVNQFANEALAQQATGNGNADASQRREDLGNVVRQKFRACHPVLDKNLKSKEARGTLIMLLGFVRDVALTRSEHIMDSIRQLPPNATRSTYYQLLITLHHCKRMSLVLEYVGGVLTASLTRSPHRQPAAESPAVIGSSRRSSGRIRERNSKRMSGSGAVTAGGKVLRYAADSATSTSNENKLPLMMRMLTDVMEVFNNEDISSHDTQIMFLVNTMSNVKDCISRRICSYSSAGGSRLSGDVLHQILDTYITTVIRLLTLRVSATAASADDSATAIDWQLQPLKERLMLDVEVMLTWCGEILLPALRHVQSTQDTAPTPHTDNNDTTNGPHQVDAEPPSDVTAVGAGRKRRLLTQSDPGSSFLQPPDEGGGVRMSISAVWNRRKSTRRSTLQPLPTGVDLLRRMERVLAQDVDNMKQWIAGLIRLVMCESSKVCFYLMNSTLMPQTIYDKLSGVAMTVLDIESSSGMLLSPVYSVIYEMSKVSAYRLSVDPTDTNLASITYHMFHAYINWFANKSEDEMVRVVKAENMRQKLMSLMSVFNKCINATSSNGGSEWDDHTPYDTLVLTLTAVISFEIGKCGGKEAAGECELVKLIISTISRERASTVLMWRTLDALVSTGELLHQDETTTLGTSAATAQSQYQDVCLYAALLHVLHLLSRCKFQCTPLITRILAAIRETTSKLMSGEQQQQQGAAGPVNNINVSEISGVDSIIVQEGREEDGSNRCRAVYDSMLLQMNKLQEVVNGRREINNNNNP